MAWQATCTSTDCGRPEDMQFTIWVEYRDLDDESRMIGNEFRFDRGTGVGAIKAAVIGYKDQIEAMDADFAVIRNLAGKTITIQ